MLAKLYCLLPDDLVRARHQQDQREGGGCTLACCCERARAHPLPAAPPYRRQGELSFARNRATRESSPSLTWVVVQFLSWYGRRCRTRCRQGLLPALNLRAADPKTAGYRRVQVILRARRIARPTGLPRSLQ